MTTRINPVYFIQLQRETVEAKTFNLNYQALPWELKMKNFNEIVSQPTNSDGSLRGKVWTTKLTNMVESGLLDVSTTGTVTVNGTLLNTNSVTAKALQNVGEGEALQDWLDYMSLDYISPQQAKTTVNTDKKPLTGHYLTAAEYKANCLKLNTNVDTLTTIEQLVNGVSTTATKDSLMQVIASIARLVITDEQLTTFNTLSEKEAIFSTVQNQIEAIGGKVTIINDTTIKVNINVSSVDVALKVLTELQFKQVNADFDVKTMSIALTMVKETI